ncbi:MAG: thiamine pyrophosphate-dependent enzyme [Candidatus Odinarchaeota archaeon]
MVEFTEKRVVLKDYVDKEPAFGSGHRLCAGCAQGTAAKQVSMAFDKPTVVCNATGCLEVASTIYPFSAWKVPWIHVAFENAAAVASGVLAGFNAMRKRGAFKHDKVDVIAQGGDGGTYDIGLQALSGALERGEDMLYICYDNGGYMNTGIQRSGATLKYATTTTSPSGIMIPGNDRKVSYKKSLLDIAIAHGIEFAASASPAHPQDLIKKVRIGLDVEGPAFLVIDVPCTLGWGIDPAKTIHYANIAVDSGIFPLLSYRQGRYYFDAKSARIWRQEKDTGESARVPILNYIEGQGRFRHLFSPKRRDDLIEDLQQLVDIRWETLKAKVEASAALKRE